MALEKCLGFRTKGAALGKMDEGERPRVGKRSSMPL